MSGLEALGLACNIFQVISFGRETASLVKRVYRDGTVDDALEANAKDLAQLAKHVQTLEVPKNPTKQEHQLLEIAKKCQAVARDLKEEIAFIVGHKKKGSLAATIKVAAKANWRKRRLDTMERKLNDAERLMQSGLLARICQKADAMHVDLKSLDISLQHFLGQYQQGHRDTSDLISTEMFRTRNHVTYELHKATDQIRSMVDQQSAQLDTTIRSSNRQVSAGMAALSLDRDREAKRQRFLASFKFPRMNERRNQVSESCEGTFQWIFADDMGMLEDPDNDTEWTNTESESFKISGDSCYQADDSDWKDDSAKRNSAPEQDDGIRWDSFIDWLRSGSKLFWCSGKPGSGKSTLMRYIISDPRTRSALEGMYCSLLHQLLASDPSVLDRSMFACSSAGEKGSDTDWSTKELQSLCFNTIKQYDRPICFFLDGLDEVSPDDGVVRLIETIHDLCIVPNVKVCVSSRPEYLIEKHLGHGRHPFIRLQDLTNQDLRTFENGLNAFDMMLMTTSMADRVLEEHEHMIHPSTLTTACHRTQNEVLVRCSGLLELPESTEASTLQAVTPWDCDQYDSVMPHITSKRTFQFIHRSAHDFLLGRRLSLSQESEYLLSLLGSSNGAQSESEAYVVGLQDMHSSQPNLFGKLSPEDSDRLCEFLIKHLIPGFSQLETGRVLQPFEAGDLGEILDDVLGRSEWGTMGFEDHLIDLGLAEAKVYVDDDGVRYSQDAAQRMMPEWIVSWLDRRRPMS
ncbi:hypothetical protein Landi51_02861 [Colletotrichum acutatum]